MAMASPKNEKVDDYSEAEAQERFEAALKGALKTPHKPLKATKNKTEKSAGAKKSPQARKAPLR
jgi:hypothetical protein